MESKFKIGDKVKMSKKTLYGEKEGVITEVQKVFKSSEGSTLEEDIKSIRLVKRFDGITLEVDYPEMNFGGFIIKAHTKISTFSGFAYTIKTSKMLTVYSEKSLKKI